MRNSRSATSASALIGGLLLIAAIAVDLGAVIIGVAAVALLIALFATAVAWRSSH